MGQPIAIDPGELSMTLIDQIKLPGQMYQYPASIYERVHKNVVSELY